MQASEEEVTMDGGFVQYGVIGAVLVVSMAAFRIGESIIAKLLNSVKRQFNDADALRLEQIHRMSEESKELLARLVVVQEQQIEILKRLDR